MLTKKNFSNGLKLLLQDIWVSYFLPPHFLPFLIDMLVLLFGKRLTVSLSGFEFVIKTSMFSSYSYILLIGS